MPRDGFPSFLRSLSFLILLGCLDSFQPTIRGARAYDVIRDYSGGTFFDGWDYYGEWDNLTLGDAWYLSAQEAAQQRLAYVNDAGHAIVKVDNTTNVPMNTKRNSIRITTKDTFTIGSLWIIDLLHLPYGCSVWPAFWSFGPNWPYEGEIDIIEAINMMPNNQMALHSSPGCTKAKDSDQAQSGNTILRECGGSSSGCTVAETTPNSYGPGFAPGGGGVWATQFDETGVFIWFWPRANIPDSVKNADGKSPITDLSKWGPPSAAYPSSSCNIPQYFSPQKLVIDITLCGHWAGNPSIYAATCSNAGPTGKCYEDMVVGDGAKFDNAYFEISYVRAYTTTVTQQPTVSPFVPNLSTFDALTTTITGMTTTETLTVLTETPVSGSPTYQPTFTAIQVQNTVSASDSNSNGSSSSSGGSPPAQPTNSGNGADRLSLGMHLAYGLVGLVIAPLFMSTMLLC